MRFLAIDLGTSFVKGALVDLDALTIDSVCRVALPPPLPGTVPQYREYDPQAMVSAARSMIEDILSHAPDCSGLVMCGQMHGLVLTGESGQPLSPVLTWLDQRTLLPHPSGQGTFFDVLKQRISPQEWNELGKEMKPGFPVTSLFWFAESGQLPSGKVIPASLLDFVLAQLCGTSPAWIEATNAMAHGALSITTTDWQHDVLARLHLDGLAWPQVRRAGDVVATLKVGSRSIPCYTPVGDFQASLTGAFLHENELSLNISTGSQVSMIAPRLEFGDYQNRPYFDGRSLRTITHIPAGRSLNALVRLLCEVGTAQGCTPADPWPYINEVVENVTETDLQVNLAFFASSFGDRGLMANIREENLTVGHIFHAAFENMANNYRTAALRLSPQEAWANLVFSGGVAQKCLALRKLIHQRFRRPYRLCVFEEDTLLGLMVLALAFSGHTHSVNEAGQVVAKRFPSRMIEE